MNDLFENGHHCHLSSSLISLPDLFKFSVCLCFSSGELWKIAFFQILKCFGQLLHLFYQRASHIGNKNLFSIYLSDIGVNGTATDEHDQ